MWINSRILLKHESFSLKHAYSKAAANPKTSIKNNDAKNGWTRWYLPASQTTVGRQFSHNSVLLSKSICSTPFCYRLDAKSQFCDSHSSVSQWKKFHTKGSTIFTKANVVSFAVHWPCMTASDHSTAFIVQFMHEWNPLGLYQVQK